MTKYIFYPGCSLQRNARSYLDSLMAIREQLGIELEEVQDWNCCGATEYVSIHRLAAYALIGRNLALAEKQANGSRTLLAACSACYLNLAKTDHYMREDEHLNQDVNEALAAGGLHYTPGAIKVRHLLDTVVNDVGLEAVAKHVTRPLKGLRVAPYYGCMVTRPDHDKRWGSYEYPTELDELMKVLGAEVVDFPMKTHCCGGHMTQISQTVAYEMIRRLIHAAADYKANIMVTLCPMCQLNLDVYQVEMNKFFHSDYHVPVLYFTQLMGLAFGIDAKTLGMGKEFVDARPVLSQIGVELPEPEPVAESADARAARKKKEKEGLPMPRLSSSASGSKEDKP
jgi:heterodisulfide reductase subunit B